MGLACFGNMAPNFGFIVTTFVLCNVINQMLAQDDANGVGQAEGMYPTVLYVSLSILFSSIQNNCKEGSLNNLSHSFPKIKQF